MENWEKVLMDEMKNENSRALGIKLNDDENGLKITAFFENGKEIGFEFKEYVLSYHVSDEGRRLKTINFLAEKYGDEFLNGSIMYEVKDSNYLHWFNDESYDIYSNIKIKHYVFMSENDIVDVLTAYEPEVKTQDK